MDDYPGMIAGAGWGLFVGFLLGVTWAVRALRELAHDEPDESDDEG